MPPQALSFEEINSEIQALRQERDPEDECYIRLAILKRPELLAQDIPTLKWQCCAALGTPQNLAALEQVQAFLNQQGYQADLETPQGWLIVAFSLWDALSCTSNPGRHYVGAIVSRVHNVGIYGYDLLKSAKVPA